MAQNGAIICSLDFEVVWKPRVLGHIGNRPILETWDLQNIGKHPILRTLDPGNAGYQANLGTLDPRNTRSVIISAPF